MPCYSTILRVLKLSCLSVFYSDNQFELLFIHSCVSIIRRKCDNVNHAVCDKGHNPFDKHIDLELISTYLQR